MIEHLNHPTVVQLLKDYGYGAVGLVIGLESLGLPLPGETLLVAAALYAGGTGHLDVNAIVIAASIGAILGDNAGFMIGQTLGARMLERHGAKVGLHRRRLLLGHYLFRHYGGLVVVLGRFTALLRALAAVLAGANRMPWGRFLLWNAVGGVLWASVIGYGAHALGRQIERLAGPVGMALSALAIASVIAGITLVRRHERRWMDLAERDEEAWLRAHPLHLRPRPVPGRSR